jgi:cellulose synthase/poly-beta-1,6-N-acetylglucosamine synthase-like glycosyltransferase
MTIQDRLQKLVMDTAVMGHNIPDFSTLVDSDLPRISVVVPSIVEQIEEVEQCIEAIGQLDYPNFEVLLVDNRRKLPAIDPLRRSRMADQITGSTRAPAWHFRGSKLGRSALRR